MFISVYYLCCPPPQHAQMLLCVSQISILLQEIHVFFVLIVFLQKDTIFKFFVYFL